MIKLFIDLNIIDRFLCLSYFEIFGSRDLVSDLIIKKIEKMFM
jgi:hypothetical protein